MKIEYSKQATGDLRKVAQESLMFGQIAAASVEARFREIIAHVAEHPEAAAPVFERRGIRVIPLVRYPYKIFYRVFIGRIRVLHIRHTSRRPWTKER
jgi:toxin ParE1/3/4